MQGQWEKGSLNLKLRPEKNNIWSSPVNNRLSTLMEPQNKARWLAKYQKAPIFLSIVLWIEGSK